MLVRKFTFIGVVIAFVRTLGAQPNTALFPQTSPLTATATIYMRPRRAARTRIRYMGWSRSPLAPGLERSKEM